jgi:septum formation topological specificity factor MinE
MSGEVMDNEPLDLDDFLASRFFDVQAKKLETYEAILAAVLRKYIPVGRKIEVNLLKASNETILDVTLDDNGVAKIKWEEA